MSMQADISPASEKSLVIKAKGGLGNRMLSGVTGLVLARLNGRTPYIDWRDGMYVDTGVNLYPLLFDAGWMGDLEQFDAARNVAPPIWNGDMTLSPNAIIHRDFPKQHRNPFLYRKMSIDLNRDDPPQPVAVYWSYLPKLKRLKSRLAKSEEFGTRSQDDIMSDMLEQHFRPVPEVTQQVDQIFTDIAGPVIGVHIRFTDRKAPLPKIVAKLEGLKRKQPDAQIFLATDSSVAQDAILSRFPDTRTIDKALATDDGALHFASDGYADPVAEARNALVDMVALSRCDWLLHSCRSTFSVTAALIGRIPRSQQIDVEKYNPKLVIAQVIQARA